MTPRVTAVRHVKQYELELEFEDGLTTVVNLKTRIFARKGLWLRLQDVNYFGQVCIDPNSSTIVWPNGVDICPDVLYGLAQGKDFPVIIEPNGQRVG